MLILRRVGGVLCAVAILVNLLACGAVTKVREAADRLKTQNELKMIGLAYHDYLADHKDKPPSSAAELAKHMQGKPESAETVAAINSAGSGGKFVVFWNVQVMKQPAGASNTVLGYEAKVPSSGGAVLMADGSVMQRTAAEFATLTKPQKATK